MAGRKGKKSEVGDSETEWKDMRNVEDGGGSSNTIDELSEGVAPMFDANGRFANGNPGGPGRRKKFENREYVDAIKASFPPDRVVEMMDVAMKIAQRTNSWRGMVAVMEFAANYTLGKPKMQAGSGDGGSLAMLLAGIDTSKPLIPGMDGDGPVIDGDVAGNDDRAVAALPDSALVRPRLNSVLPAGTDDDTRE